MATVDLTPADALTLHKIFDPESAPNPTPFTPSPTAPADPHYPDQSLFSTLQRTELSAINLAESNQLDAAFSTLSKLLSEYPKYASAYNNRAQLRRMMGHPREEVIADLNHAVQWAEPVNTNELSAHQAKVLTNALTQRGLLTGEKKGDDAARGDMERAAALGGGMAREWTVKMNPYARLCGAIVGEALGREIRGEGRV